MQRKLLLIAIAVFCGFSMLQSQSITKQRCSTMENDARLRAEHPEMGTLDDFERWIDQKMAETAANPNQKIKMIYNIPVIVHVIHNGEAVGSGSNISQAQVNSQFDVLNEDYSLTNADTTNIPAVFKLVAANCEIHFCPAVVDPQGNLLAEPGIDRVNRNTKGFTAPPYGNTTYIDNTIKTSTSWDPTQYMNMWCCDLGGGLLGYAQFPSNSTLTGLSTNGGAANMDGVVIVYTSFGRVGNVSPPYHLGRTATHEVGHWLGLRHINGDGNCQTDYVGDTPTQSALNYGCPAFPHVTCTNGPNGDMFMNYMDYVDDNCMNMFTVGQKARMVTVMTNATLRASLNSSTVCSFVPSPPIANFTASPTTTCVGVVDFQDQSSAAPTAWSWNFGDGTTSTVQNPTHTYTAAGTYSVTLTTSNANGADTLVKNNYITVNMPTAPTVGSSNVTVANGQTANLTVTSGGTINWYNSAQVLVGTGTSYTTPPMTASTVYYAQASVSQPAVNGGPVDNSMSTPGIPGNQNRYLIFDVFQNCTLKSVKVYAQGAGNRTIELRTSTGTVLADTVINLAANMSVIDLNFPLTVGTSYQLGVNPVNTINLLRNNSNAVYPYTIGTLASITGNGPNAVNNAYYYFYDWSLEPEACLSGQTPVNVTVTGESITNALSNGTLNLYPNPGNGFFKVVIDNNQYTDMQVRIFNTIGQLVYNSEVIRTNTWEKEIDLNNQAKGTYFVQIRVGDEVVYKKYMLE